MNGLWWWIDRWRKSSAFMDMTLEQQGAYRNLLDEAALRGGPLPNDERVLAKACGDAKAWRRVRSVVMNRFELYEDGWRNPTLDELLARSAQLQQMRAEMGRRGGQATQAKRRANDQANSQAKLQTKRPANGQALDPISGSTKKRQEREKSASLSPAAPSNAHRDPFIDPVITERAGDFIRRYRDELYPANRAGARYLGKEHRDYEAAVSLCETWPDDRLEKLAICFLTTNHKFAAEGSRTIPQFRALASWLDGELAKWESEHASA